MVRREQLEALKKVSLREIYFGGGFIASSLRRESGFCEFRGGTFCGGRLQRNDVHRPFR